MKRGWYRDRAQYKTGAQEDGNDQRSEKGNERKLARANGLEGSKNGERESKEPSTRMALTEEGKERKADQRRRSERFNLLKRSWNTK